MPATKLHSFIKISTPDAVQNPIMICLSFTIKRSLDKHVTVVHEKIKPFVCESCGYTAGGRATLKRHFEVVHEKKKPFKCIYCDFRTALNANLKKHMNIHKGNESIKYFF